MTTHDIRQLDKEIARLDESLCNDEQQVISQIGNIASEDFYVFMRLFWKEVGVDAPFKHNWHVEAITDHLEALARREIKKLGINIQPRLGKSTICSQLFPVWRWTQRPEEQFITGTYGKDLTRRDADKSRQLIRSDKFMRLYGDKVKLRPDMDTTTKYENTRGGYRYATTVRGGGTGEGADCHTPYTNIYTSKGVMTLEDLFYGDDPSIEVLTHNHETGKDEWLVPKAVLRTDLRDDRFLVRIHFDDGSTTDCTNDHRWYSPEFGYIKAENLGNRSELHTGGRRKKYRPRQLDITPNHAVSVSSPEGREFVVTRVERLPNEAPSYQVYTLSMPPNGNYYVVASGTTPVLCQNSLIVDDPHKAQESRRPADLATVLNWYTTVIRNRYNDPNTFAQLIIHQRICENDLMGFIIAHFSDFVHLRLPCEYEGDKTITPIGWSDPRTKKGELIAPMLFTKENADEQKAGGQLYWESQYQQSPTVQEGGLVRKKDLNFYDIPPRLETLDKIFTSWDLGEGDEDNDDNPDLDYSVVLVWGLSGRKKFLLNMERGTWIFTRQLEKFQFIQNSYKNRIFAHLIEKKSNGSALANLLSTRYRVRDIEQVNVKEFGDSKEKRLELALASIKNGELYLPNPDKYSWSAIVIDELLKFPTGRYDDCVDATSQFINFVNSQNYEMTSSTQIDDSEVDPKNNPLSYFEIGDAGREVERIRGMFDLS